MDTILLKDDVMVRVWVRRSLESLGVVFLTGIFSILSVRQASALGGWIGRHLLVRLRFFWSADRNLQGIFPHMTARERQDFIRKTGEEWGRVAAEYVHLTWFVRHPESLEIRGKDIIDQVKASGRGALFVSAHLSHFQMISVATLHHGLPLGQMYRRPSNPIVAAGMVAMQKKVCQHVFPRSAAGTRHMIQLIKNGQSMMLLTDQMVLKSGMSAPLLGHMTRTSTTPAELAHRLGCAVIPVHVRRIMVVGRSYPRFVVTFHPPLDPALGVQGMTLALNNAFSDWILQAPTQWLWMHPRWPFSRARSPHSQEDQESSPPPLASPPKAR